MSRNRGYSKATVRALNTELRAIKKKHNRVTRELVVKFARDNPQSKIASFFDFTDVKSAAEKYWLEVAGDIISRVYVYIDVKIDDKKERRPVRVWVSRVKNGERGYDETTEVLASPTLAHQFLLDMRIELEAMVRRYETYRACSKAVKLLKTAITELKHEEEKTDKKAAA